MQEEEDDDIDLQLSEESDLSSHSDEDDEDALLGVGSKRGKAHVDISRLTKRQRMTLLANNTSVKVSAEKQVMEIGRHNKDSLLKSSESEGMFYALGNKKPKAGGVLASNYSDGEDQEDDDEDDELSYPKFGKNGKPFKNALSIQQQEEKKRQ